MNSHLALSPRPPRESDEEDFLSDEPKVADESQSVGETWCAQLEDSTESAGKGGQGGLQHQGGQGGLQHRAEGQGGSSARTEPLPKARFLQRGKKVFQQILHLRIYVIYSFAFCVQHKL